MVISFFKRAFKSADRQSETIEENMQADPEAFVDFVVKQLVDEPDQVKVQSTDEEDQCLIEVQCAKPDMGKVIGKGGKTIDSIRALAASAGKRVDKRVRVEVLD